MSDTGTWISSRRIVPAIWISFRSSVLDFNYNNGVIPQSRRYTSGRSSRDATQASPYGRALVAGRETLRATVVDVAGAILANDGPAGLTMRRLATALGCTTTVLYTMFASKQ